MLDYHKKYGTILLLQYNDYIKKGVYQYEYVKSKKFK